MEINCDYRAVVDVLSFGRARDPVLSTCARNVWLSAMYNVTVVISHIAGIRNTSAYLLSRWHGSRQDFVKLKQHVDSPIWFDTHIDLTLLNKDI